MSDCLSFDQLLEPDPDQGFAIVNNNGSPAFFERGSTQIPMGAAQVVVPFLVQKLNADYSYDLAVRNTVDPSPLAIEATLTSKALGSFVVGLSGLPDTANYFLDWEVEVTDV